MLQIKPLMILSARQSWFYLRRYAAKLRLLFGISKVFEHFSWRFIKNVLFSAGKLKEPEYHVKGEF